MNSKLLLLSIPLMILLVTSNVFSKRQIEYELISNTYDCLTDCSMIFKIRFTEDLSIYSLDKFKTRFDKTGNALNVVDWGYRIRKNETYKEDIWIEEIICDPYDVIDKNKTVSKVQNCSDYGSFKTVEKWHYVYKDFDPLGKTLESNKWYYIELWGKKPLKLGENNIDAIPIIDNFELPFDWWNSSWAYRLNHTIHENNVTDLTNYQVEVTVNTSLLTNFYHGGERWVNSTGTELYFWRNNSNTENVTYWVKVPNIPSSGVENITLYYGNTSFVNDSSDMNNTFIWNDGFEDGLSRWTIDGSYNTGRLQINGTHVITGNNSGEHGKDGEVAHNTIVSILDDRRALTLMGRTEQANPKTTFILQATTGNLNWAEVVLQLAFRETGNFEYYSGAWNNIGGYATSSWFRMDLTDFNFASNTLDIWINGTKLKDNAGFRNSKGQVVSIIINSEGGDSLWDNMFIREWVLNEPSFSTGLEEAETPPDTTPPYFTTNETNSTVGGEAINFSIVVHDDTDVNFCRIETNNTGSFINASWSFISGTEANCYYETILNNSPVDIYWRSYANDTSNNKNVSQTFSFTVVTTTTVPITTTTTAIPFNFCMLLEDIKEEDNLCYFPEAIEFTQDYAEIYNYSANSSAWTFALASSGVYYNLTGLGSNRLNGFTFTNEVQAKGGSYLTSEVSGLFSVNAVVSMVGVGGGGLHGMGVVVNSVVANNRNCYSRHTGVTSVMSMGISCILSINVGDVINIQIEDESTPAKDIKIHTVNLNLVRIGE